MSERPSVAGVSGEFVTETFDYDGGRQVTVYVPPDPPDAMVFAGDGQVLTSWAADLAETGPAAVMALALGLRHPQVFGAVFCASPGAGFQPPAEMPVRLPRTYIVAGTQEPFFLENAIRWARALAAQDGDVVLKERAGSHGDDFWRREFPLMVAWAFR